MKNKYMYGVRNTKTGKMVSDLTSKHKKYWEQYPAAVRAINNCWYNKNDLEVVAFELKEVPLSEARKNNE